MRYRPLGSSGIEVSEIGLGSWLTYAGGVERDDAEACVRRALDAGITLIDTANSYADGGAEAFLGSVLADVPRESFVLATKVFNPMGPDDKGLSAAQIHKQLDASLQRLRVDHVDLYQCHRYDPETPLEETMSALTEVVRAGKVRAIGFSEWTPEQIKASFDFPDAARFTSSQPMYNALWRKPEREVFPVCDDLDVGQIVFCPLAQGVLTGKYLPGAPPPADSRAASDEMGGFIRDLLADPVLEAVQQLRAVADAAGLTLAQLSLAWVLQNPSISAAIIGASRPSQIDDNLTASGVVLDDDTMQAIDDALEGVVQR